MTDWPMVIITSIYVIATIVICIFHYRADKLTREQIDNTNRPFITVLFDIIRSGMMCFVVENAGNTFATNVNVHINISFIENIPDERMKEGMQKLQSSSLYLAAHQKIHIPIDSQLHFSEVSSEIAIIKVSYDNYPATEVKIDISQYSWMLLYKSAIDDSAEHLKKIYETLDQKIPHVNYISSPIIYSGKGMVVPIVEQLPNSQGKPQKYLSVLNDTYEVITNLTFKFRHPQSNENIWKVSSANTILSILPGQKIQIGWISPMMNEPATAICEMSWTDRDGFKQKQSTTL
jgi:hypothetical protein